MNYYEHHLGDYAKDAGHLSLVEEGAYRRLLDAYYTRERALPVDLRECCKLARAQTKPERDAVAYVLGEFFRLEADGHHQGRADEEIERYLETEPEREAKRENDRERQRRSRERRRALFEALRGHGIVPAFDAKTNELEALLSRATNDATSRGQSQPVTRDNTVTQTPVTNPHSPDEEISNLPVASVRPPDDPPVAAQLALVPKTELLDCPHLEILDLWAQVLPALHQHEPEQWKGARADHLRARWREQATAGKWTEKAQGITYFRRLFVYVGRSPFLSGRAAPSRPGQRPFRLKLEWLVSPLNFAKVVEGTYHEEQA